MRKATQNHAQHAASTMSWTLERALQYTVFVVFAVILFCLVLLTPSDAIYQCYVTQRLTNIFIITGGYIVTFLLTALIYATRIYTNRTVLSGIPKAWIPIEKEDVGKSVRRLVVEGLARSAIIAYQARPRDPAADAEADAFDDYPMLQIDAAHPPWGAIEHPGWSAPHSPDLPDLPYRTVVQELPHLIEAKAVSLAPPDPFFLATRPGRPYPQGQSLHPSSAHDNDTEQSIPDTRVVDVLRRPAAMGLREYLQRLAQLDVLHPPEIGPEFLGLYERARFSAHALHEAEFRSLMHVFADLLRGMRLADPAAVEGEIYAGGGSRVDSESLIGPSDEEGETDAMEYRGGREEASRPSDASSAWDEGRSVYATPVESNSRWGSRQGQSQAQFQAQAAQRLRPQSSARSLQRMQSGSSSGSVIHLVETRDATELPYAFG